MIAKTTAEELEALLPISDKEACRKYGESFEKQARYRGYGVYNWHGILASDTRVLFLLGVLAREGIEVPEELRE